MKYNLSAIEKTAATVQSSAIKNHVDGVLNAVRTIERSGLQVAYHVAAIKPLLEGNTDGLTTDFVEFCKTAFGVEKAQAYNLLAAGSMVAMVSDEKGKSTIYVDMFHQQAAYNKYVGEGGTCEDYAAYFKALKKGGTFGSTQLTSICRAMSAKDRVKPEIDDIIKLIDEKAIYSDMTVKELETVFRKEFPKLIESKGEEQTETPTEEQTETPTETPTETATPAEFIEFKLGKKWFNEQLMPELERVSAECPAIAEFIAKFKQ